MASGPLLPCSNIMATPVISRRAAVLGGFATTDGIIGSVSLETGIKLSMLRKLFRMWLPLELPCLPEQINQCLRIRFFDEGYPKLVIRLSVEAWFY